MKQRLLIIWLPLVLISCVLFGTVYAILQQNIRQAANDPQIQLAEDGAVVLAAGMHPAALVGASHVQIDKSLAPFVTVYDDSGKVLASSGYLGDTVAVIPTGVLEFARTQKDHRVTWEPAPDVRIAAVVVHYQATSTGFILAGRNLREVEQREYLVQRISGLGLFIALVITFIAVAYAYMVEKRKEMISKNIHSGGSSE